MIKAMILGKRAVRRTKYTYRKVNLNLDSQHELPNGVLLYVSFVELLNVLFESRYSKVLCTVTALGTAH